MNEPTRFPVNRIRRILVDDPKPDTFDIPEAGRDWFNRARSLREIGAQLGLLSATWAVACYQGAAWAVLEP